MVSGTASDDSQLVINATAALLPPPDSAVVEITINWGPGSVHKHTVQGLKWNGANNQFTAKAPPAAANGTTSPHPMTNAAAAFINDINAGQFNAGAPPQPLPSVSATLTITVQYGTTKSTAIAVQQPLTVKFVKVDPMPAAPPTPPAPAPPTATEALNNAATALGKSADNMGKLADALKSLVKPDPVEAGPSPKPQEAGQAPPDASAKSKDKPPVAAAAKADATGDPKEKPTSGTPAKSKAAPEPGNSPPPEALKQAAGAAQAVADAQRDAAAALRAAATALQGK